MVSARARKNDCRRTIDKEVIPVFYNVDHLYVIRGERLEKTTFKTLRKESQRTSLGSSAAWRYWFDRNSSR